MRKSNLTLTILLLVLQHIFAQQKTDLTFPLSAKTNFKNQKDLPEIHIQNLESPKPDGNSYQSELLRRKELFKQKYPGSGKKNNKLFEPRNNLDSLPRIGLNFEGNLASGSTPCDNTTAISNNGILISAINTNIRAYDITSGTNFIFSKSLSAFAQPLGLTSSKYDPKIVYDPYANRFIIVFLNGFIPSNSKIIVGFSTDDNPNNPWNLYSLPGNPYNDTSWSDYPAIEVNEHDLFITMNLLWPDSSWQTGFKQTVIWQINKNDGYAGNTLNTTLWNGLQYNGTKIRNLHPVREGMANYAANQYFVSNRNFAIESDTVILVEITNSQQSGLAQININLILSTDNYFLNVDAPMPSAQLLTTNDARILGATKMGDIIQFVQNSSDTATGNSAIFHGFIDVSSMQAWGNIVSSDTLYLGYPNIASVGFNPAEQASIIAFDYSSAADFPGVGAVFYDGNGNYSPIQIIKKGTGSINVLSGNIERWGDYFGIQRKYNEPCKVWVAGMWGKNSGLGTWLAELASTDTCSGSLPAAVNQDNSYLSESYTYPNPFDDAFFFELTLQKTAFAQIYLYDSKGSLIQILYSDKIKSGNNKINLTATNLPKGLYFMHVIIDGQLQDVKKIIKY